MRSVTSTGSFALRIAAVCLVALLASGTALAADDLPVLQIWPNAAPLGGSVQPEGRNPDQDQPTLTVYLAKKSSQTAESKKNLAVVVCPGGGYGGLAVDHEGKQIAEWLNDLGISAFVLRYRVAPYKHPVPLLDAQRAVRTVRARAEEFGIDPQRVGMIGFSAGGHLVSTVATHFNDRPEPAADAVDEQSARPDFVILVYPVISLSESFSHAGSRRNLLGDRPSPELVASLSNETQVRSDSPPAFLVASYDDTVVPPENSVMYYLACRKAKVPVELHLFEPGRHGFGLAKGDPVLSVWPSMCEHWMQHHKWLPRNSDGTPQK